MSDNSLLYGPFHQASVRDQITFGSRTKSNLGRGLNHIWVRDQNAFWSTTKSHWAQNRITFGSGKKLFLSAGSDRIWVGDQIALTKVHKERTKSL